MTGLAGGAVAVYRALFAHGDHHGVHARALCAHQQRVQHLEGGAVRQVGAEQPSGLNFIADEHTHMAQKLGMSQDHGHVAHDGVNRFAVLLREAQHHFGDGLVHVDLEDDVVRVSNNLLAVNAKVFLQRAKVGLLGHGSHQVAVLVED